MSVPACLAIGMFVAQPCAAAGDRIGQPHNLEQRQGAFAGLNLQVRLGGGEEQRASARLGIAAVTRFHDRDAGSIHTRIAPLLEVGARGSGEPSFSFAGREEADLREKLAARGSTENVLLAGLLVVAALGALLLLVKESGAGVGPES